MSLLRKIIYNQSFKIGLIFALFVGLHIALFNVNVVEWGDSYRILRASEFIKNGDYPQDEKRPPLFSLVLSLSGGWIDPVVFGRLVVFLFSSLSLIVFYKYVSLHTKKEKYIVLALLLFTFNPVYLYWSIRVMSDVFFGFWVLVCIYLLKRRENSNLTLPEVLIVGALCGLAILTRFEGYILLLSVGLHIFLKYGLKNLKLLAVFFICVLCVILPWIIYRNPLMSAYFSEPAKRIYDFKMIWIYVSSLVCVFGVIPGFYFIINSFKSVGNLKDYFIRFPVLFLFLFLELFLILLWPAAIPRLFVPLIPFLLVLLVLGVEKFFNQDAGKISGVKGLISLFTMVSLVVFYIVSQLYLNLEFLLPGKKFLIVVSTLQLFIVFLAYFRRYVPFVFTVVMSAFIWSIFVIYHHRDIYITTRKAAEYASHNLSGVVVHNDINSVADWFLNFSGPRNTKGVYHEVFGGSTLTCNALKEKKADYFILTNEHNTSMDINLGKRPYLEEIKSFEYNVNGSLFFAKILKFVPERCET